MKNIISNIFFLVLHGLTCSLSISDYSIRMNMIFLGLRLGFHEIRGYFE